jgi:branched-chain amino acid transport system substrate-binding protein
MRSHKRSVLLLLLLALSVTSVLFLSACGGGTTTTTAAQTVTTAGETVTTAGETVTTEAPAAFTGEDITIGVINSMTGPNALTGEEQKWAQEKAIADTNAAGGVTFSDGTTHKLVLKFADDKSDPAEGASAMEKLIKTDGLKIILGSNITPVNQAAATVAEQYGAYYHINTSWTDDAFIGGMGLKWTTDMFESAADAGLVPVGAVQTLAPADQPKNWAIMVENTPDGEGLGGGVKALAEAAGFNVVSFEKFVEGNSDFSSIIMKFKEAKVDAVVTLIAPTDGITFVKQCREADWAPKFMFGYKGFWPVNFMKTLGADSDYICNDGFWSELLPYPGAAELGQAFKDSHDGNDSVSIGLPYAAVQVLVQAINKAGSVDPGAVRDQVVGQSFAGTTMGDVTYNAKGICEIPFIGLQWKDGKRTIVYPKELSTGPLQLFVPWADR